MTVRFALYSVLDTGDVVRAGETSDKKAALKWTWQKPLPPHVIRRYHKKERFFRMKFNVLWEDTIVGRQVLWGD